MSYASPTPKTATMWQCPSKQEHNLFKPLRPELAFKDSLSTDSFLALVTVTCAAQSVVRFRSTFANVLCCPNPCGPSCHSETCSLDCESTVPSKVFLRGFNRLFHAVLHQNNGCFGTVQNHLLSPSPETKSAKDGSHCWRGPLCRRDLAGPLGESSLPAQPGGGWAFRGFGRIHGRIHGMVCEGVLQLSEIFRSKSDARCGLLGRFLVAGLEVSRLADFLSAGGDG